MKLFLSTVAALTLGFTSAACPSVGGTFKVQGACSITNVKAVCSSLSDAAITEACETATV